MRAKAPDPAPLAMIAAFGREVSPLLRRQRNLRRLSGNRFAFQLQTTPVVLAIAGAGAENAYRVACELIRDFSPAGVVSIGFAGGLSDTLKTGELLRAEEVIEQSTGERFRCQASLLPAESGRRGRLLAAADVVSSVAAKRALAMRWEALAVDMESGGVARAAKEQQLPFAAIKSITDAVDRSIGIDFQRCRSDDGGLSIWKVVREGITSPRGVRDLWRLACSSRRAAGNLALALCSV
jgi:nucleoside phosphorylase